MVDINKYIEQLIILLREKFASRLLYVGLQGSYLREEATSGSDMDIMVVIDQLSVADLSIYRTIIQNLPHFEKSCGFICSKEDIANWNPLEIWHLLNGTKDYLGQLRSLVPEYTRQDILNFVKLSISNLYHEICHRYIHAEDNQSIADLACSYKGVFFILQNLYYLKSGEHIAKKTELLPLLDGKNQAALKRSIELSGGIEHDFADSFELLFTWCQETLKLL